MNWDLVEIESRPQKYKDGEAVQKMKMQDSLKKHLVRVQDPNRSREI